MKMSKNNSAMTSQSRITKYVTELSALEKTCRNSHSRNWAFPYLMRIYELHENWQRKGLAKERRADLNRFYRSALKKHSRKDKKLLHLIIECTSAANSKTRSTWVSALFAARLKKIKPKKITRFLLNKDRGGLKSRSAEYAAYRKRGKIKKQSGLKT